MTGIAKRLKIKLRGGGPWGFRLQGGPGTGSPLTVSKVRRKSKAYNNLREGDQLVSANGIPCDTLSYDQVMAIADKTGSEFNLEIERKEEKHENSTFEVKSKVLDGTLIHPEKTTQSNTTIKMTETKTTVTETSDDMVSKETRSTCASSMPNPPSVTTVLPEYMPSNRPTPTTPANEDGHEPLEKDIKTPDITSDISRKTSAEITPTGEKFEKLETEKIREKDENKETTIIRTDYEERVKSRTTSSSPPVIPPDDVPIESRTEKQPNESSQNKNVTSETYEVHKTEKTEITTTTMNGFPSTILDDFHITDGSEFGVKPSASKASEAELPFATPMATVDTLTEIDEQSGSITVTKKKKMFSSSSFYEEPHAIYPTVEEQFEMAKKIAESLADDTNKKSKGANMFFKRAKRSTKWIHEGPEPSSESAPDTPEILPEYPYTELFSEGGDGLKKFPKLKLVLDPRHPVDLASLRSTGHNISEHNVISPEICHELVRDLESPKGKGSALFAKRKKKSSEWVVDEEKVKALMKAHERDLNQARQNIGRAETPQPSTLKSPWDTSLHGRSVSPLVRIDPDALAETVIAAADVKRRDSIQLVEEPRFETCRSPIIPATPAASYYDIYKPKAPKGWATASVLPDNYACASAVPQSPYPQHAEPFPSYASLTAPSHARKFNFQNFNTLPRKWKARN